jgi:aminoglycoside/choline kinase family phosphotransferase
LVEQGGLIRWRNYGRPSFRRWDKIADRFIVWRRRDGCARRLGHVGRFWRHLDRAWLLEGVSMAVAVLVDWLQNRRADG